MQLGNSSRTQLEEALSRSDVEAGSALSRGLDSMTSRASIHNNSRILPSLSPDVQDKARKMYFKLNQNQKKLLNTARNQADL